MTTAKENANKMLIEMYNKEIAALKAEYPTFTTFGPIHENTPEEIETQKEYETKHHEIYTRYFNIWAALK